MLIAITVVLGLILLNGVFAMSELAVMSARRARLIELAEGGHAGARQALALANDPTRFLSTVQVGITAVGILSGAIGEATIATRLRAGFEQIPSLAVYADALSLSLMVS
jgi:putative hemolysin